MKIFIIKRNKKDIKYRLENRYCNRIIEKYGIIIPLKCITGKESG